MTISADQVKELRERTGAGMMECKKALVEAQGDIELALENLRKKGQAQDDKKASNIAAEGVITIKITPDNKSAVMLETNCQTDFVARDENFRKFAELVASRALEENITNVEDLAELTVDSSSSETLDERRKSLVATLGEKIQLRRLAVMKTQGSIGTYLHGNRIGVMVQLEGENKELGKDLAMHIAASNPRAVAPEDIPQSVIEKEREIFLAQAQASGKPIEIVEKMVDGRIKKYMSEECLLGQPFVKDPSKTVGNLLANENAKVTAFIRFVVGEGIEKKVENFADEVMAQVRGSK